MQPKTSHWLWIRSILSALVPASVIYIYLNCLHWILSLCLPHKPYGVCYRNKSTSQYKLAFHIFLFFSVSCHILLAPWRLVLTTLTPVPSSCPGCAPSMGTPPSCTMCWSSLRTVRMRVSVCVHQRLQFLWCKQLFTCCPPATDMHSFTRDRHMVNSTAA